MVILASTQSIGTNTGENGPNTAKFSKLRKLPLAGNRPLSQDLIGGVDRGALRVGGLRRWLVRSRLAGIRELSSFVQGADIQIGFEVLWPIILGCRQFKMFSKQHVCKIM